jgi:regulatory protein
MRPERSVYQIALDLLSRRDHFRSELEEKLRRRNLPENEIADAIARCERLGLIDDLRIAERFVEVRAASRGWGPRRLVAELRQRGVPAADAESIARLPPGLADEAVKTALRRIELRAPEGWWRDGQRRARMVSSLITRGFETDVSIAAVDRLADIREKTDHAFDDQ